MLCCTDTVCDVLLLDYCRASPLQGQRQEGGLVTDPALAAHNELGIIIFYLYVTCPSLLLKKLYTCSSLNTALSER